MRTGYLFAVLALAICILSSSGIIFDTCINNMTAMDYLKRSEYLYKASQSAENGGTIISCSNITEAGTYSCQVTFPSPQSTIYCLQMNAIMQVKDSTSSNGSTKYIPLDLNTDVAQNPKIIYYFELSSIDIETLFLNTTTDNTLTFKTAIKFFANATENSSNVLYLQITWPIFINRPLSVTGSTSNIQVTSLTSILSPGIDINLNILSTLDACTDSAGDLTTCTKASSAVSYPLYSMAKFRLSFDDPTFFNQYYLRKYKVDVKTFEMNGPVDFSAFVTCGEIRKGEMIFTLPMSIVSNQVTISATAEISSTLSRRMLDSSSEGTIAFKTFSSFESPKASSLDGIQPNIIMGFLLFAITIFIL